MKALLLGHCSRRLSPVGGGASGLRTDVPLNMVHTYVPGANVALGAEPDNCAVGRLRAVVASTPAPSSPGAVCVKYNETTELDATLLAKRTAR